MKWRGADKREHPCSRGWCLAPTAFRNAHTVTCKRTGMRTRGSRSALDGEADVNGPRPRRACGARSSCTRVTFLSMRRSPAAIVAMVSVRDFTLTLAKSYTSQDSQGICKRKKREFCGKTLSLWQCSVRALSIS